MSNIFGGSFFGKPVPLAGAPRQGPLPVVQPGQAQANPANGPLGVQRAAMTPNGPVPMGQKKDCPVCRG
jgi:hypothetical protein